MCGGNLASPKSAQSGAIGDWRPLFVPQTSWKVFQAADLTTPSNHRETARSPPAGTTGRGER